MKALTLHQPWAWLVAFGMKEVETRRWSTNYRGPLAIHAGKEHDGDGKILHLRMNSVRGCPAVCPAFKDLPFGCVMATCNLVAVLPTHIVEVEARRLKRPFAPACGWELEKLFGNYAVGRFAWILRDVVPVDIPIPAHGWQQLWNWTPPASVNLGLMP